MLYVYRREDSKSAAQLARALRGARVYEVPKLQPQDVLVCWGEQAKGEHVLNGKPPLRHKKTDAVVLQAKGIATIEVSDWAREGWIGREGDHSRGSDLLQPPGRVDYYVKREEISKEYRVHMFRGLSIRAGQKVPRAGFEVLDPDRTPYNKFIAATKEWKLENKVAHPWIRSYEGGWDMRYDGVTPAHRTLAKQACEALELDFGAVDIGERPNGSLFVLEVNRAPALDEGDTVGVYVGAVQKWVRDLGL